MTRCWIMTEGLKGTENQCIALAEAAGLSPEVKTVKLKQPWKTVTPWVPCFSASGLAPGSSEFNAPWPDVIIASGRKAIAPALWVKRQSGNKAKLIIIQSPVIKNKAFDLIVVPKHDQYKSGNVFEVLGALSIVTPQKLEAAKVEWQSALSHLPAPRLAVLIGGNSRKHKMTENVIEHLSEQLQALAAQNYGLMITASRRTPDEMQQDLRRAVTGNNVVFWDGTGANPYLGYLASADAILVTEDSVSMACEAISTGKPVYIIPLEGGSFRFKRFHDYLIGKGYARWFEGRIDRWSYDPPQDLQKAATRVKALIS